MEPVAAERPHVLAIPFPLVGHMTPIVQLCRMLIATAGCRVTIACNERDVPSLRRLLEQLLGEPRMLLPLAVLPIPDGLPLDLGLTWDSLRRMLPAWQGELARGFAPHMPSFTDVACVVSDVYLSWTQDVADQLGVPRLAVWAAAAAEYQVYFHAKELVNVGKLPFKAPSGGERGTDNMLPSFLGRPPLYHRVDGVAEDEEAIKLDGLPGLNRRDFPTFLQIQDSSDVLFYSFIENIKTGLRASMVLFNSFEALEGTVVDALRSQGIPAHCIGPLFLLEEAVLNEQMPATEDGKGNANRVQSAEVLDWLDGQRPRSVLYVAFGTIVHLAEEQARELALGLVDSEQPFVWVYPITPEGGRPELPEGFWEKAKGKGLVVEWAPQKRVLSHPSIGGFLSHCGWNSSLEAMCCGVPILGLPFVSDQPLHCKMMVDEWKAGLRLERSPRAGVAVAADVSRLGRALLAGESGRQLRKRAQDLQTAAHASIRPGGASRLALDAILKLVVGK